MSTTVEHAGHFELEPRVKVARARAGVLFLILSDSMGVLAMLAGWAYLNGLNAEGQFRGGEHAPALVPGIVLVVSGVAYYLWGRVASKNEQVGPVVALVIAWVLMIAALVYQTWIAATLGYTAPFHAYASIVILANWFSAVHLLLATILGLLLLGRIWRGRIVGHGFVAEVCGYWWYYTVAANLLLWIFVLLLG